MTDQKYDRLLERIKDLPLLQKDEDDLLKRLKKLKPKKEEPKPKFKIKRKKLNVVGKKY